MKVAVCGRRWGKTALGLMCSVGGHGAYAGDLIGAVHGGKVWWVAPSHPIASEIWRDLKRATKGAWTDKSEIERRVELVGGGSVTVRSAVDPETLIAVGLDGLVIDEAAKCEPEVWDILRPTLADRQGWCLFIGTPKGFNWFHDKFEYAGRTPGWARWQRPSGDNPLMTTEELTRCKQDAPRLYGQEYEARFEQPEGAEWPPEYFPESLWFSEFPGEPVMSVLVTDPSLGKGEKKKGCFAFILHGQLDGRGTVWVEAWCSQAWDGGQLGQLIAEHADRLRPTSVLYEGNGGQSFLGNLLEQLCKARGFRAPLAEVIHTQNKEERIRSCLTDRLRRFEFRFRDTPGTRTLVNQCREFPVGEFLDGPDALAMLATHFLDLIRRKKR